MKCKHDVTSYEWTKCSKCGKYVRVSIRNKIIAWILFFFPGTELAFNFADFIIDFLNLSEYNPHNVTHALIGGVFLALYSFLIFNLFPDFEEKNSN